MCIFNKNRREKEDNFRLDRQIRILYLTGALGNLSITGAWVAILSARGFSLVQIGFAETVFHITSLICEIPSGMMADAYGRRRMLVLGNVMAITAELIMAFSGNFFTVCLSMPFHAMAFNFASGSGEALAYDSMKLFHKEEGYEKYVSDQSVIFRIASGISTLCAGIALILGYKTAYLISAAMGLVNLLFTLRLTEVTVKKEDGDRAGKSMIGELISYFRDSVLFLKDNSRAAGIMLLNSFVGAVDILLLFFLQSKLRTAGISDLLLGISLFIMELGGILGAKLILRAKNVRYVAVFITCTCGVLAGLLLEHTAVVYLMTLGGFISSLADDAIEIRTGALLQDMFPSEQRATLISISSFTFSLIMIVLSPLAGYFFSVW